MKTIYRHLLRQFRGQFATGLLVMLPLLVTIFLVSWLLRWVDQLLGKYFAHLFGEYIFGVGLVSLVLLIWLAGVVGRTYIGSRLNHFKDGLIARIPMVGTIFSSVKKVSDGLLEMNAGNFEQVVMVEYPRKGLYAIGFVTSRKVTDFTFEEEGRREQVIHVFLPSVPNPTTGYVLLLPEREVQRLNLTVEEGLKLILSLGMIYPAEYRATAYRQAVAQSADSTLTVTESAAATPSSSTTE